MKITALFRSMMLLLALVPGGHLMAAASSAPAIIDPTSELAPPPFEITGPEDLSDAIEKARFIDHPNYKEKIRYQRTTHISFPLPKLDNPEDLSRASVAGAIGSLPVAPEAAAVPAQALVPEAGAPRQEPAAGSPGTATAWQPAPMLLQGNTRGWSSLSVVNN